MCYRDIIHLHAMVRSYTCSIRVSLKSGYNNPLYYMEESVLLGTKPLVDSIRHFIRDPSGVFSVCHLCECRIVPWRHDSRLLLLLNWFLHIIKRTLHVGSKIWILCSCHSNIKFISSRHRVISSMYLFSFPFLVYCYMSWHLYCKRQ